MNELRGPNGESRAGIYFPDHVIPKIKFAADGRWPIITIIHEIGHFLDQHGWLPNGKFTSENAHEFENWRQAVENTEAVRRLRSMEGKDTIQVPDGKGGLETRPIDQEDIKYFLHPTELWARSYAQHIATEAARAGHFEVASQLNKMLEHSRTSVLPGQWQPEDFEPVAAAIEKLLATRGLK